ncbi:MAG: hypothetical protein ACOXZ9_09945 [Bacteroidales bacterium]|jgi:hypothetical protein
MKYFSIILIVLITKLSFAQGKIKEVDYIIKYKKIAVVNKDSIFDGYIVYEPNGSVYFADTCFTYKENNDIVTYDLTKKKDGIVTYNKIYEKIEDKIDTVYNLFPTIELSDNFHDEFHLSYQFTASYLLDNIGEKKLDYDTNNMIIRLIFFNKNFQDNVYNTNLIKFYFDDAKPYKVKKKIEVNYNDLKIETKDEVLYYIDKRNKKILLNLLEKINSYESCVGGNLCLIEYKNNDKYKYTALSEACLLNIMYNSHYSRDIRKIKKNMYYLLLMLTQ